MIKDALGRKWYLRFRHYTNGWWYDARTKNFGATTSKLFKTKALAERDVRKKINDNCNDILAERELWLADHPGCTAKDYHAAVRSGEIGAWRQVGWQAGIKACEAAWLAKTGKPLPEEWCCLTKKEAAFVDRWFSRRGGA